MLLIPRAVGSQSLWSLKGPTEIGWVCSRSTRTMYFVQKIFTRKRRVFRYCKRAKNVFKELEETPFVVELDQREDGAQIQDALYELVKRRAVPQVFIDGEHIGGSDDSVEAHRNGRLKKLLGSKQSGAWQHDVS
ncbi:unnamed protein product [Calypogeia fissa]